MKDKALKCYCIGAFIGTIIAVIIISMYDAGFGLVRSTGVGILLYSLGAVVGLIISR